jgi:hypothetical protein
MNEAVGSSSNYQLHLAVKSCHAPEPHEPDIEKGAPTRAAGITPAPGLRSGS